MQPLIRPPSESFSHLVLAMEGCSHNKCTFCPTYKKRPFRLRDINHVIEELKQEYHGQERIFLADGDALAIPQKDLIKLLTEIKEKFKEVKRVSSYITPRSALNKTKEELEELRNLGLQLLYLGVETGNEQTLKDIKKGVNLDEMINSGKKIKQAGIKLSITILLGLAGKKHSKEHALDTADIINKIRPDYVGALTLMVVSGTEFKEKVNKNEIQELDKLEYLKELRTIVENIKVNCIFRSNHASNYLDVNGTLTKDKDVMLKRIDQILNQNKEHNLKPEFLRGL